MTRPDRNEDAWPTDCRTKGRVGGTDGAAARIGINRTTLISRMKKLGVDPRQHV